MFLKSEEARQIKCTVYRSAKFLNSSSDLTKFCTYFSKSYQLLGDELARSPRPLTGAPPLDPAGGLPPPLVCCFHRHWKRGGCLSWMGIEKNRSQSGFPPWAKYAFFVSCIFPIFLHFTRWKTARRASFPQLSKDSPFQPFLSPWLSLLHVKRLLSLSDTLIIAFVISLLFWNS